MKIRRWAAKGLLGLTLGVLGTGELVAQDRAPRAERYADVMASLYSTQQRGVLGVTVDPDQPTRYDESGARLTDVRRGSPAWDAGLEPGDIIVSVNGHALTRELDEALEEDLDGNESLPAQRLIALAREFEPGAEVEIEYMRDGESESVTVELADEDERHGNVWVGSGLGNGQSWTFRRDGDDERLELQLRELTERASTLSREAAENARLMIERVPEVTNLRGNSFVFSGGMHMCPEGRGSFVSDGAGCIARTEIREIDERLGAYFDVEEGLLVVDAAEDNPLGLVSGDVIQAVDGREVMVFRRLRRLLDSYDADEEVVLTVVRDGRTIEVEGRLR